MGEPPEEQREELLASRSAETASSGRRWLVVALVAALAIAGVVYADASGTTQPGDERGAVVGNQPAVPTPRGLLATGEEAARGGGTNAGSPGWTAATVPTADDWPVRGSLRDLPMARQLPVQVARTHPYHRAQLLFAENVGDGQLALTLLRLEDQSSPSRVVALWRPADAPNQRFREIGQAPFTGDQRSVSWAQTTDGAFADVVALGPPGPGHSHVAVHRLTASGRLERKDHQVHAPDGVAVTRVAARSTRMLRLRIFTGGVRLSDGPPVVTSDTVGADEVSAQAVAGLPPKLRDLARNAVTNAALALAVPPGELTAVTSWGRRDRRPNGRRIDTVALTLLNRDGGAVQTVWRKEPLGGVGHGRFTFAQVLARRVLAAKAHRLPIAWLGRDVFVVAPEKGAKVVRLKLPGQPAVEGRVHGRLARVNWPYDKGPRGARVRVGRSEPYVVIASSAVDDDPLDVRRG